jgi:hypothetical protein
MTILTIIGLMAALFIPQIMLHEGAHAIAGKHYGLFVDEIRFWPGRINGKLKMGWVKFEKTKVRLPDEQRARIAFAPLVSNTILYQLALLLVLFIPAAWPLVAVMIVNAIDGTYNSGRLAFWAQREDLDSNNDSLKWVKYEKVGLPWGRVIAALWIAVTWLGVVAVVLTKWFPEIGFELE